jgi:hypothetical protein
MTRETNEQKGEKKSEEKQKENTKGENDKNRAVLLLLLSINERSEPRVNKITC